MLRKWGIFDLAIVNSKVSKERFQKIALLGSKPKHNQALYLKDNNTPLMLVGNTAITGNAYLPERGVKPGNIAGVSFYSNTLINGQRYRSGKALPEIFQLNKMTSLLSESYKAAPFEYIDLEDGASLQQSFNKPTLLFESNDPVKLDNVTLKGKIIVGSSSRITIKKTADLQDIILIAPEIVIESYVTGTFQAFATKFITVNKGVKLNYPSVLVVLNNGTAKDDTTNITIGENATIKGSLIYTKQNDTIKQNQFNPQVHLKTRSIIIGDVYCNGNIELSGDIRGTVITDRFIARQGGSVYLNHIYNGIINRDLLSPHFLGMPLNTKKEVAKWLN